MEEQTPAPQGLVHPAARPERESEPRLARRRQVGGPPSQVTEVALGEGLGLPPALPDEYRLVAGEPEDVDLDRLVLPPAPDDRVAGERVRRYQPLGVVAGGRLEDPGDVGLPAPGGTLPDGGALAAVDQVGVVAQDREPVREVVVGDFVQRVG